MAVEEFIKADKMRDIAKAVSIRKEQEAKQEVMKTELYEELASKIRAAAEEGNNSVTLYPRDEEFYNDCLDSHKLVPEEAKNFDPQYQIVTDALRSYGGFNCSFQTVPIIYENENTARINSLTIYW